MGKELKLRPKSKLVIILDELDFSWHEHEIDEAIRLWNKGENIVNIAQEVRPAKKKIGRTGKDSVDEVALLIMHLSRQKKIKDRPGGVWGCRYGGE